MNNHQPSEETILEKALAFTSAEARQAYLQGACGDNQPLRAQIESLIEAHEAAGDFLPNKPAQMAPTVKVQQTSEEGPGTRIGRYKLLQQIGEGGMGVVYMAEQEEPVRRRVALKIIKLGMDTRQVVARFEAERQALALMDHPNIAKIYDGGIVGSPHPASGLPEAEISRHAGDPLPSSDEGRGQGEGSSALATRHSSLAPSYGRPYFVMELVQGVPITDFCDKAKLSAKERLKLFIQVCQAVQHAHQKGIIHRDIKPSNVLVTLHDGVPVPKVIDFGIAKATNQKLTEKTLFTNFATMIGTPAYMSPEQAEMSGLDIDTRTDIYALGVLLYALLTGTTPFPEKRLRSLGYGEMQRVIIEEEPERPSTRLSTMANEQKTIVARNCGEELASLTNLLKGDLDWIVMKCLEKDRQRRYETANGLASDIQRHLSNEPVIARPPSTAYRLQKAIRRNKLAFAAGAAVVFALVVGITISTWETLAARKAQRESDAARKLAEKAQQAEKRAHEETGAQRATAQHLLYIANMNVAQRAWEENNIDRLRQILEETESSPDRGFEWYFWQPKTRIASKTFRGHRNGVISIALSKDGSRMVSGSNDGTVKVWNLAASQQLLEFTGHGGVRSVAFCPDDLRVAAGDGDHMTVWDIASGRELFTVKGSEGGRVESVAYSPDGRQIATASSHDVTVRIWDASDGKQIREFKCHEDFVCSVRYSPDGQRLLTCGYDNTAMVWQATTGQRLLTLKGHKAPVFAAVFSPDGQRIATGSSDTTGIVWDAVTGRRLFTLKGHFGTTRSIAFSPDGERILTGSDDASAKLWAADTGEELLTYKGHGSFISSVCFFPDGQRFLTANNDSNIKLWDVNSGFASTETGQPRFAFKGHSNGVWTVAYSPDGTKIVTGSRGGTLKVWDAKNGHELLSVPGHTNWVLVVAFSPDGQCIASTGYDATMIWDAASGRVIHKFAGASPIAFAPDGQRILLSGPNKSIRVWDIASARDLLSFCPNGGTFSAAFSPDGQRILTASGDGTATVWDSGTGVQLLTLRGHGAAVFRAAFSPDGRHIVTGSEDRTAKVWDAESGKQLRILNGHGDWVWTVAFSPDGRRILTGSDDQTAKLWDFATGRELLTLRGHGDVIRAAIFSPDGRRIVTGSQDGTARVWEAATREQVAAWQKEEAEGVR